MIITNCSRTKLEHGYATHSVPCPWASFFPYFRIAYEEFALLVFSRGQDLS